MDHVWHGHWCSRGRFASTNTHTFMEWTRAQSICHWGMLNDPNAVSGIATGAAVFLFKAGRGCRRCLF
eukprot:5219066-Lingulodinium_polyedra.AAC.1